MSVTLAVYRLFDLIMLLMLLKIFLSWLPNINWGNQPFRFLYEFTEIFFGIFRKILPPIGMLDLSPIVAFIVLRIFQIVICKFLASLGV